MVGEGRGPHGGAVAERRPRPGFGMGVSRASNPLLSIRCPHVKRPLPPGHPRVVNCSQSLQHMPRENVRTQPAPGRGRQPLRGDGSGRADGSRLGHTPRPAPAWAPETRRAGPHCALWVIVPCPRSPHRTSVGLERLLLPKAQQTPYGNSVKILGDTEDIMQILSRWQIFTNFY